ncbi:MAG: site-specific DNA-methyltransferase [Lachnospiraceae bacterium]|nr:site-specific DNA-methyltransferase [Lachnospiraceae bacterium]
MEKMRFETVDGCQANVEKLAELFPSCVKEGMNKDGKLIRGIDMEALSALLGDEVLGDEKCEFTWVGKKKAIMEANKSIRKTLRPVIGDSVQWDTTGNIYIEGDNLDALKLLQGSYLNAVKVIYIDPPYNTGNDFIYLDDYKVDGKTYDEEIGRFDENGYMLFKNTDTNGRYHSDWCSMIFSRLTLARNLLTEDGTIFISIDDNEQENMKKICDEIFGERNFVNCFIWNCSTAGGIRPKFASKTHEYIYCYARDKSKLPAFFAPLSEEAVKMYNQKDEKGRYRDKDFVFKNKSTNVNQKYEIVCPDGERVHPKDGYIYRFVRERFDEALKEGLVTFKKTTTGPLVDADGKQANWNIYIKKYLGDAMGAPSTLIPKELMSIYNVGTQCVQDLFDGTRVFENVKPVNVIQYFINMVAEDGDIVMDFFSGSATTAHAVMQTEVDKNISLNYILVQVPEKCDEKSDAFKAGYTTICEIGRERIKRAAAKIRKDNPCDDRDFGFRVFKVDESNMNDVYYSAEEYTQDLLKALEEKVKSDRTDLDLLFGCLLEWGLPLSVPYCSECIDGYTVHTCNDGKLVACFDENISDEVVKTIAGRKPQKAVFKDSCFGGSPAKINVMEMFKVLAPDTQVIMI